MDGRDEVDHHIKVDGRENLNDNEKFDGSSKSKRSRVKKSWPLAPKWTVMKNSKRSFEPILLTVSF